jgi:hypothetical protein
MYCLFLGFEGVAKSSLWDVMAFFPDLDIGFAPKNHQALVDEVLLSHPMRFGNCIIFLRDGGRTSSAARSGGSL